MSVRCPFCDADNAQLISLFGSQLLLSQYRCRVCGAYFEAVRDADRADQDELQEVTTNGGRAEE